MVIKSHDKIDQLLDDWKPALGRDYLRYRNHVYRVFNFSVKLSCATGEDIEKLALAAAFHDVGIWLDNTFDYLDPSTRHATAHLSKMGREEWIQSMEDIIGQHHKLFPWRGRHRNLVESFRKADWLDVCCFVLPIRMNRVFLVKVLWQFPCHKFHRRLISLTLEWMRKHPFNPLPIFKF